MNTEHQQHQAPDASPPPEEAPATRRAPAPAEAGAPEAIQAAQVARNNGGREKPDVDKPTRGVDWVRASDLLARGSGAAARRGIDFEERLGRSARHGIAVGAKYVGRKTVQVARKLPPLSAFGRDDQTVEPRGLGRA